MIKAMRTKQLMIAALTLPLAFAACTNEEFAEVNKSQILESEKVVGKTLIADGAVIKLLDDAQSRVSEKDGVYNFDKNDKLGLAWFNNPDVMGGTILEDQATNTFVNQENKIYNNYLVQYNEELEQFEVNGEMYEGAYFIYYPYQKIGQGGILNVDYSKKNTQTVKITDAKTVNTTVMTNSLHLSDKFGVSGSNDDFKLEIQAAPLNTMNTFAVSPKLVKDGPVYEATKDLLGGIRIKSVEISTAKTEKLFANKATVDLTKLPAAQRGKKWNSANTKALVQATVLRSAGDPSLTIAAEDEKNLINTVVENGNTLADENLGYILLSTFATKAPSVDFKNTATVKITTNVGYFTSTFDKTSKLIQVLTGKDADDQPLEVNFMNATGKVAPVEVKLDMANFYLTTTGIKNPEDWNYLMKLLNAQGKDATVTVNNLEFTEEVPMELPEDIKITVKSGNITFASGVQTIGKEFTTNGKLIVAEGATLNLNADVTVGELGELENNGTTNVNAVLTTDKFNNVAGGTVNVAEGMGIVPAGPDNYTNNGTINCYGNIGGKVANAGGVINVTYGATTVLHNNQGVIHGILDVTNPEITDQTKAIMQMIGEKSEVKCNSIELIGFELTEGDKSYEWSAGYSFEIGGNTFNKVNVKLENSTLNKKADSACEFSFKGLTLVKSTVTGDIKSTAAVVAKESTVAGNLNASGKEVKLSASTVTGDVTGAAITLESTEVTGDVSGTTITIDGGSITGDVKTTTKDFTIENATVNGKLTVAGEMTINNSIVTAANGSTFAKGLIAEISTLEGSFIGLTKDVKLTNCTINASEIETAANLVINANDVIFSINNTVLEANDVTFNGNKNVAFTNTKLEALGTCYVNTNVTGKDNGTNNITADDYEIAPKKSIGFTYVEK